MLLNYEYIMNKINKLFFDENKFIKIMLNKIKALNEIIFELLITKNQ